MCVPRWAESNFLLLVGSCEGLSIKYTVYRIPLQVLKETRQKLIWLTLIY